MKTSQGKNILILTTSQPASNPRAVKEAVGLEAAGFFVTLVYTVTVSWGDAIDQSIIAANPGIRWVRAGKALHHHPWYYRYVRLRRKLYELGYSKGLKNFCADFSSSFLSQELYNTGRRFKADLVIAHNLGALPVAARLSRLSGSPYAFDAEDFHRGESREGSRGWNYASFLEDRYFPGLSYLTVSSPLTQRAYQRLYPGIASTVVLNVFPLQYLQPLPQAINPPLRVFWFSQRIGRRRGLEDIIAAMGRLQEHNIQLTLLGNCRPAERIYFEGLAAAAGIAPGRILFAEPVNEGQLPYIAAAYDIGLATEVPDCQNPQFCLSNKLFIYLLAGNAVLFSDTPAQRAFLAENPGIGMLYRSGDITELSDRLITCIRDPAALHQMRVASHTAAATRYNWEWERSTIQKLVGSHAGNPNPAI
jgi:glycosyltransferase involved in cell wall biosynthesis